jgi:hypothetical protein
MTKSLHRIVVSLGLSESIPAVIVKAQSFVDAMTGNSWFPDPVPPLSEVQAAIDKLRAAESDALSGTKGLKQVRDDALRALKRLLDKLKAYVKGVAEANPEAAGAVVESARMSVGRKGHSSKPELAIFPGRVSGEAHVVARAVGKDSAYDFEASVDGGKTWFGRVNVTRADTTMAGLEPGVLHLFRRRVVMREGTGDWGEPVQFRVQ